MEKLSKWWYLDLAAEFPEIEMYHGGWRGDEELLLLELGERAMDHQAHWLWTWIYSTERDRIFAAVTCLFGYLVQHYTTDGDERPSVETIPADWVPAVLKGDQP